MGWLDRVLTLVGLDFDLDLQDEPFHRITPHLHLGRRPRPDSLETLQQAGITHVVSCLPEAHRASMAFLDDHLVTAFLPLRDSVEEDIGPTFRPFFDVVDRARKDGGQLLVHCEVGVSRSATLATAVVMRSREQRFYDAYAHVRARRPQVLPNIAFASQLQALEGELLPHPQDGHSSLTRYLHEVCHVPVEADVLEDALQAHGFDALPAIRSIFGDDIPRVIQGVRR